MDWKAVDPTESNEVNEVIELLDVSFPVDRDYIEREVVSGILSNPGKEGQLYRLRSIDGDLIATVTYGQMYGDGWDGETAKKSADESESLSSGNGSAHRQGNEQNPDFFTFVRFFAVHPDHRRQGHAAWIIKKIMNDAQACGSRGVALSSLQSDKIAAGIWERRGFTVYATQPCEEYPENGHHDCYVYWFSE